MQGEAAQIRNFPYGQAMTLEELIATLTTAQEQATDGEWIRDKHRLLQSCGLYRASADRFADAQAIAIRHNTAGEVLKWLSALDNTIDAVEAERNQWRTRAEKAEAELATANGYRAGISDDLRQVEDQSSGLAGELCKVVSLLDESPARSVLFGPADTDGVAYIVKNRLDRDAARVADLEAHADDVEESQSLAARQRDDALARVAELVDDRDTAVELAARLEVDIESLNLTDTELTARVVDLVEAVKLERACVAEYKGLHAASEAKAADLGTEVARLNAGWHEANGKVLEVGLERTQLKAELELRSPMPKWEFQEDERLRLELGYASPLNGSKGCVKDRSAFYGLLADGQWGYAWLYRVAWTYGELTGQTTVYTGNCLRSEDQSGKDEAVDQPARA